MALLAALFETFWTAAVAGSLLFFVPLWGPSLVFGTSPFGSKAASPRRMRIRSYNLTDLFVVISFAACGNAILMTLRQQLSWSVLVFQVLCLDTLVLCVWIQCQQFMKAWGIDRSRERMWMQLVFYPCAILALGQIIFSTMSMASMISLFRDRGLTAFLQNQLVWSSAVVLCLAISGVLLTRRGFDMLIRTGLEQDIASDSANSLSQDEADNHPLNATYR